MKEAEWKGKFWQVWSIFLLGMLLMRCSGGDAVPVDSVQTLNSLTLRSTDGHIYAKLWWDQDTGGNLALFDTEGKDKWWEWWNALLGRPNPPVTRMEQLPKGIR